MSINDLRRSQIVIPFGPGGIYDYKEFSAMTMDIIQFIKVTDMDSIIPMIVGIQMR